ncbi:MAG TPA: MtrB/PioB family outer membrane beta-barrel protein [Vicinamibacterales bacterium]|nr:MtrB/PioB family outer membrane beta-barrel protein [Vicinamibacterales bacterium]
MRNRIYSLCAAVLLASATQALAQDPPTKPVPPAGIPLNGLFDVGFRGTSIDGDEARYERYRDTRDGAATFFNMGRTTDQYRANLSFANAGYRDQFYGVEYHNARVSLSGSYSGIPLNWYYDAPLVWNSDGRGRLTLDAATRAGIQGPTNAAADGSAVGVPCAPGLGPTTCNATTSAQAKSNRSIYNNLLRPDDMSVLRSITAVSFTYRASDALAIRSDFTSTGRNGEMPWAASFAFNNANVLPAPIDHRNNELKLNTEWVNQKGMFRLDYWGSFFENSVQTLTWDNPIRATDFNNGLAPPNGPYDPSAYTNGNGPAFGQAALWPSNILNSAGATGMLKVLPRTTVNGNVTLTYMRQNESLLPWSLNTSINNDLVFDTFHSLRQLPRASAEASVNAVNAQFTLNSRVTPYFTLAARYRYNDHNNNTPHFDGREYVRFDGVPEELGDDPLTSHVEGLSEYFQITRKNFDASGTFNLRNAGSLKLGYAHEAYDREGRGFSEVGEHMFRLAYDATLGDRANIRVMYDAGQRRGDGFIISGVDYETGPAGTQPGLRYYDEADRDRNKASVIFSVNPVPMAGVYVQYSTTRDEFFGDESIPAGREFFGLQTQDIEGIVGGVDISPNDTVSFGLSYGRDEFSALQKSRNANPPPDPSWTDPSRNWTLDNNEVVNTFMTYLDLVGLAQSKADVRFSYEMNDSDNAFNYGGPRIPALQAAGTFIPLPNIVNEWNRFTVDLKYFFTAKVGLGVGYWWEKLDIEDWNTIDSNGPVGFTEATGIPRIDWLGGLMTGYGNRPYDGNTFFVRALVRF